MSRTVQERKNIMSFNSVSLAGLNARAEGTSNIINGTISFTAAVVVASPNTAKQTKTPMKTTLGVILKIVARNS